MKVKLDNYSHIFHHIVGLHYPEQPILFRAFDFYQSIAENVELNVLNNSSITCNLTHGLQRIRSGNVY